jgi:hypothetical protein
MSESVYFSGQGKVYVSDREASTGVFTGFTFVGNVPSLKLSLESDVLEHNESRSGSRLQDFRLVKQNKTRISMTLENFNKFNLNLLTQGTEAAGTDFTATSHTPNPALIISGSSATENIPSGSVIFLPFKDVSAVTITDSAGTPNVLTGGGTHYVLDSVNGKITTTIALVGGTTSLVSTFTPPLKITAYTLSAVNTVLTTFTSAVKERALFFEGLNTANANKPVRVEVYRVIFDPVQSLDLINDELAQFELEGSALYDSTRASSSNFGGFARIIGDSVL